MANPNPYFLFQGTPGWGAAHHGEGEGKIFTLPGGTRFLIRPYTGADKMSSEDPSQFEVYSFLDGDPKEWQQFLQENYYKAPRGPSGREDRIITESDRYWDAVRRMKEGAGLGPNEVDWLPDLILRKTEPGA